MREKYFPPVTFKCCWLERTKKPISLTKKVFISAKNKYNELIRYDKIEKEIENSGFRKF